MCGLLIEVIKFAIVTYHFAMLPNTANTIMILVAISPRSLESIKWLPRSEHWATRRWHWHRKGQKGTSGPSGIIGGLSTRGLRVVGNSGPGPSPEAGSSSITKSMKPD